MLKLYTYFRSSASYRVRIALNLKGLPYESVPVHLLRNGGEQHANGYPQLNPAELVPTLVDGERALGQSLAIMEYLDEVHPSPPLLPGSALDRARIRAIAQSIACEMHPLNNLRVLQYLAREHQLNEAAKAIWVRHWITIGFTALEAQLNHTDAGAFCHGDSPTLADCCLVPQVFNARRFATPLDNFPTICRIEAACLALEPFLRAMPEAQIDAV